MALANNDLLIIQRPATKAHYKIKVGDFLPGNPLPLGTKVGQLLTWNGTEWIAADDRLPNGTESGQHLSWNGTSWIAVNSIDGGTY